ncbi:ferrochelatase [Gemmatimonadota bacterium]
MSRIPTDRRIDIDPVLPAPNGEPRRRCALLVDVEPPAATDPARIRTLSGLAENLTASLPAGWDVYVAYDREAVALTDLLDEIIASGFEELVVTPLSPQFSSGSTGELIRILYRQLAESGLHLNVATRTAWFDDIGYVNAHARHIADFASARDLSPRDCHLLFTVPLNQDDDTGNGDRYEEQLNWTLRLITQRLGWPEDRFSVMHRTASLMTNEPDTAVTEQIEALTDAGETRIMVTPLLPVTGHTGIGDEHSTEVLVCDGPGASESFVTALKNIVTRGPQRITGTGQEPILVQAKEQEKSEADIGSLVMIGVSTARENRSSMGPRLHHCDPDAFGSIKKHRKAILDCLDQVRENGYAEEAFVWNTCQRVEFYGWLTRSGESGNHDRAIAEIRRIFFGTEGDGVEVNTFQGEEAWYHLVRTAAGLNSDLPGDTDVLAQLQTACRIAGHSDMKGPKSEALMEHATVLTEAVRAETSWGRYATSYCHTALTGVEQESTVRMDLGNHVVIGGSTTSHSILRTLAGEYSVHGRRKTVVYRCHHGQMKLLRSALGDGRRLRVHAYSEESVIDAITGADFVYFGIDHPDPVLDATILTDLRDFGKRPLLIMDFNSFGSLTDTDVPEGVTLWTSEEIDTVVTSRTTDLSADEGFHAAVREAGAWIEARITGGRDGEEGA